MLVDLEPLDDRVELLEERTERRKQRARLVEHLAQRRKRGARGFDLLAERAEEVLEVGRERARRCNRGS